MNLAKAIGILLALFSVVASPAAFTPAVLLACLLMTISGLAGWLGHLKWAVAILAISSVAVCISPVTDIERFGHNSLLAAVYAIPAVLGYAGVILGVHELQKRKTTSNPARKPD